MRRPREIYLRWEESEPPELHRVEVVEFVGKSIIRVTEMPLHHKRLGDVSYAYGESKLGEQPVRIVVSESEGAARRP